MDGGFRVLRLGKAKQVLTAAGRRNPLELACHMVAMLLLTTWSHGVPSWAVPNFSRMGCSWLASGDMFLLLVVLATAATP